LEKSLSEILTNKVELIKTQDFEGAANARKMERDVLNKISLLKKTLADKIDDNRKPTTIEMVTDVVSSMTGIPLNKISTKENQRLIDMDKELNSKVIGQEEAITKISKAIKRSRVGIKDHRRPLSVFMLLGGSGTGKTLTAKLLAEHVFGDSDALIRIDMSEYMEKFSISRLIGPPPGYVGYEQGGQLTEKIRRRPYSVILLDEIEKAHDDVFNLLLQVFDEGHLTDSLGRKVNFKNTLILMTSNLGVKDVSESTSLGFTSSKNNELSEEIRVKGIIDKALKKRFKPEFLNRLDDTIIYNNLSKEHISKIVNLELDKLNNRIKELGYTMNVSDDVVAYLGEVGYDSKYGARPLNRAIQKYIEDEICEAILNETVSKGQILNISIDNETKKISIA
jgi:ATP-dependent Clp protease ATP-binding subunit ClpC